MKSKENYLQSFRAKERAKLLDDFKKDIKKESTKTKKELKVFFKSKEFKNLFKEYLNKNSYWNLINNDDYINSAEFISLYDKYLKTVEITLKNEERKIQRLLEMQLVEEELDFRWHKIEKDIISSNFLSNIADICLKEIISIIEDKLKNSKISVFVEKIERDKFYNKKYLDLYEVPLTKNNFREFLEQYSLVSYNALFEEDFREVDSFLTNKYLDSYNTYHYACMEEYIFILKMINDSNFDFLEQYVADRCLKNNKELEELIDEESSYFDNFYDMVMDFDFVDYFYKELHEIFKESYVLELVRQNPYCKDVVKEYEADLLKNSLIKDNILKSIPEDITLLYPLARKIKRHFVLHIGPTNSGKTYEAIEKLKKSEKGIYLAPLRLMAFENYHKLNSEGISCTMETGEEILKVDGANHFSKTIELLNINTYYDIAVIDECQMIEDNSRGGAWTRAIIGLNCPEIHICMAKEAENIVIKLIEMCGDSYEIVEHVRKTKLEFDDNFKGFNKGDALILFSRRDVLNCASDLQKKGFKCSILYGMLPYDVRHKEVEKFVNGDNDILISTDVIGMGMNLPIKRIVFLRDSKYDGYSNRFLNAQEIKQIAGRAGRFGIYDIGYVTSSYNGNFFRKALNSDIKQINKAVLGFPETLINIDGTLSKIISEWSKILPDNIFKKNDINDMLMLCDKIETYSEDKELLYNFLTIPFDVKKEELIDIWFNIFKNYLENEVIDLNDYLIKCNLSNKDLNFLENLYQELDLLFNCFRKFGTEDDLINIMEYKKEVVLNIDNILAKQNLTGKKCKCCGKSLKWDYVYNMCNKCYSSRYYYDDWY